MPQLRCDLNQDENARFGGPPPFSSISTSTTKMEDTRAFILSFMTSVITLNASYRELILNNRKLLTTLSIRNATAPPGTKKVKNKEESSSDPRYRKKKPEIPIPRRTRFLWMQIIRHPDAQQILCRKNHHGNKLNDSQYFLYSPSLSKVWRKVTEIFNRMTKTIKTSKHRLGISVLFPICIISNALFYNNTVKLMLLSRNNFLCGFHGVGSFPQHPTLHFTA